MKLFLPAVFLLLLAQVSCSSKKTPTAQSGTATSTDGAPVFYRIYGSGSPLLIINGGPGMNSDGFENLALQLSEKYQAILYDQRGTGKSILKTLDSTSITLQLMVDDIEALRKQLKIEKWSVLGHSFGGMLASYYATRHPECIEKIVLSSSGGIDLGLLNYVGNSITGKLPKAEQDSVAYWTERINKGDTSHYARLKRGEHLAPAYVIGKQFMPVIAERLTQGNGTVNQLIWGDMQRIGFDCKEGLKDFNKPVLIIQGKEDIVTTKTAEGSHAAFKNSRIVYMDHCIHYGWLDNPEVYFKEINSFLAPAG